MNEQALSYHELNKTINSNDVVVKYIQQVESAILEESNRFKESTKIELMTEITNLKTIYFTDHHWKLMQSTNDISSIESEDDRQAIIAAQNAMKKVEIILAKARSGK